MSRPNLIRTSEFPYHISSRTNNQEWFHIPMEVCWSIFVHYLLEISQKFNAKIGSFVLMSNHFHMILWTPDANIDQIMHYFLTQVSKALNQTANRVNHVFGNRYKWSLITTDFYLFNVYKYIYRNPTKARIVEKVEDYPFSTLFKLSQGEISTFPVHDYLFEEYGTVSKDMKKRLEWLNEPFSIEQEKMIQRGLKRSTFILPKHRKYKKQVLDLKNRFPKVSGERS